VVCASESAVFQRATQSKERLNLSEEKRNNCKPYIHIKMVRMKMGAAH